MKTQSSSKSLYDAKTNEAINEDVTTAGKDAAAPVASLLQKEQNQIKRLCNCAKCQIWHDPVNTVTRIGHVNTHRQQSEST